MSRTVAKKLVFPNSIVLVIFGSLFLAISGQMVVPLPMVPITLQTFAVLFIGMIYGPRLGFLTVLLYLFEGACGLPVFAQACGGLPFILGATGGYLIAFPFAALFVGYIVQQPWAKNYAGVFFAALCATALIWGLGALQLAQWVGWSKAYLLGIKPFIYGDLAKVVMITLMMPKLLR